MNHSKVKLAVLGIVMMLSGAVHSEDQDYLVHSFYPGMSKESSDHLTLDQYGLSAAKCSLVQSVETCSFASPGISIAGVPISELTIEYTNGKLKTLSAKSAANMDDVAAKIMVSSMIAQMGEPQIKDRIANKVYEESDTCSPVGRYEMSWLYGWSKKVTLAVEIASIKASDGTPFDVHDVTIVVSEPEKDAT